MSQLSEQFVTALQSLESSREVDSLAALFADDADIASPLMQNQGGGAGAAHAFWTHYRGAFDEIRSTFKIVRDSDGVAFLEWRSEGVLDGQPFAYDGVSVIEQSDGKISAFRTYFDTRSLPVIRTQPDGGAKDGATKGEGSAEGDLEQAQREAAEQRAQGGYS